MLAKNKRNYVNYFEDNQHDIIAYIQHLEDQIEVKSKKTFSSANEIANSTRQETMSSRVNQLLDLDGKLQKSIPGFNGVLQSKDN